MTNFLCKFDSTYEPLLLDILHLAVGIRICVLSFCNFHFFLPCCCRCFLVIKFGRLTSFTICGNKKQKLTCFLFLAEQICYKALNLSASTLQFLTNPILNLAGGIKKCLKRWVRYQSKSPLSCQPTLSIAAQKIDWIHWHVCHCKSSFLKFLFFIRDKIHIKNSSW